MPATKKNPNWSELPPGPPSFLDPFGIRRDVSVTLSQLAATTNVVQAKAVRDSRKVGSPSVGWNELGRDGRELTSKEPASPRPTVRDQTNTRRAIFIASLPDGTGRNRRYNASALIDMRRAAGSCVFVLAWRANASSIERISAR